MNRLRLRGHLLALTSSLALGLALAGTDAAPAAVASGSDTEVERLIEAIRKHRDVTWHWQRVMRTDRWTTTFMERRTTDLEALKALRDAWKRRADRVRDRVKQPPRKAAWLCIHRHEGSWKDPRAPYWGGLQMSRQFQRAFGRYLFRLKGTANKWTPAEQMWTAVHAHRSGLGFHPWPNTARACGLL